MIPRGFSYKTLPRSGPLTRGHLRRPGLGQDSALFQAPPPTRPVPPLLLDPPSFRPRLLCSAPAESGEQALVTPQTLRLERCGRGGERRSSPSRPPSLPRSWPASRPSLRRPAATRARTLSRGSTALAWGRGRRAASCICMSDSAAPLCPRSGRRRDGAGGGSPGAAGGAEGGLSAWSSADRGPQRRGAGPGGEEVSGPGGQVRAAGAAGAAGAGGGRCGRRQVRRPRARRCIASAGPRRGWSRPCRPPAAPAARASWSWADWPAARRGDPSPEPLLRLAGIRPSAQGVCAGASHGPSPKLAPLPPFCAVA